MTNFISRMYAAMTTTHGREARVAGVHPVKKYSIDINGDRATGIIPAIDQSRSRGVTQSFKFGFGQPI